MDENLLIGLFIIFIVVSLHCHNIIYRQPNIIFIQINNINKNPSSKYYYDNTNKLNNNEDWGHFIDLEN